MNKIAMLEEMTGMDEMEMIEQATYDSVAVGICTNKQCSFVADSVEPDCSSGFCEHCGTQTVASILVLEGMI